MPKLLRIPDFPLLLAGDAELPPAIAWRLLDSLLGQLTSFVVGSLSMLLMGLLWWARTRSVWPLVWTGAFAAITLVRFAVAEQYRRNAHAGEPRTWARRFTLGTWANGLAWGAASFVVVADPDPFVQFLVIAVQSGFLAGGAARNHVAPAAAIGQVLLARVPLLLACFATGNVYYICFTVFVALHIYASIVTIRYLGTQNLKLLLADREKAALIEQVNAANAELQSANRRLEALAAIDGLTGLMNRRVFDITLSREWFRGMRQQEPLSLLMIDLDCFKQYNDRYGHVAGDDCLKLVARTTSASARRMTDRVALYGGEELAVLLPNTDAAGATGLAERARLDIEALAIPHSGNPAERVTVSIGIATLMPAPELSPEDLVRRADVELYRAKQEGRNRACAAGASGNGAIFPPLAAAPAARPQTAASA